MSFPAIAQKLHLETIGLAHLWSSSTIVLGICLVFRLGFVLHCTEHPINCSTSPFLWNGVQTCSNWQANVRLTRHLIGNRTRLWLFIRFISAPHHLAGLVHHLLPARYIATKLVKDDSQFAILDIFVTICKLPGNQSNIAKLATSCSSQVSFSCIRMDS